MKIRHPLALKVLAFFLFWLVRLWMATLRTQVRCYSRVLSPRGLKGKGTFLLVFWHENLLLPFQEFSGSYKARALVSQHADGELAAQVLQFGRVGTIRGSATRGGVHATRQLMNCCERYHLVLIPDGPRGPRRKVKPSVIQLAARTGLPIIPAGVGYQKPWRMPTWDRFALPKPFTRAGMASFDPIFVPPNVSKYELEGYCRLVEEALDRAGALAAHWAETGRWPSETAAFQRPKPLPLRQAS